MILEGKEGLYLPFMIELFSRFLKRDCLIFSLFLTKGSLLFFHKFFENQIKSKDIVVIQVNISLSLHHRCHHLTRAKIRRSSEDCKRLVTHIFPDDIRKSKIDEDRFLEMLAHYYVLWLDVLMDDFEEVHNF